MADVITGDTQLGDTKNDLIAGLVQKELAFNAVLTNFVTDVTEFAVEGMDAISFPKLTSFTVTNRAEGVAGETTALTASNDKLTLDINAYVAYTIDKKTVKQSNIKPQLAYAKRAASAHARFVDINLISKVVAGCYSFENVGSDADVTYASLLSMAQKHEENDGMPEDSAWWCSVSQKYKIMALTEFKDASVFGGQAVIPSGVIGYILGRPVVVHNGLAAKQLFLVDKNAVAIGFQINAEYGEQEDNRYGVGAKRAAVDQLYGITVLQQEEKGAAAGKSPLIIGLND